MKTRPRILIACLSSLSLLLPAALSFAASAETNAVIQVKAPTGFYVTANEIAPAMAIRIGTNGNYHVDIGPCGPFGCGAQDGTWQWDSRQQEFALSPKREPWRFDLRRFRVDPQAPGTLEWIPRQGTNNVLGVYKTIKFTRQRD